MDLDVMEQNRFLRPRGKFHRKGPSNKERERRKKDNLYYNYRKSGYIARECDIKLERLYIINNIAGIEVKKADTSIEKELA
jgi:hypothetical protein